MSLTPRGLCSYTRGKCGRRIRQVQRKGDVEMQGGPRVQMDGRSDGTYKPGNLGGYEKRSEGRNLEQSTFLAPSEGPGPVNTWHLDFWPPELRQQVLIGLDHPVCGTLSW